jgi:hypothetical protein
LAIVALIAALFFVASPVRGEEIVVDTFGYLNNNESSLIIANNESQDLLNVNITPGGKSVEKREGYGLYKTLPSGQAIHGGHHFFNANGNDVQIWGSSTSLYGSVGADTPTQLISSATLNATWDCTDTDGNAYCVNSSRDVLLRTNGATKSWFTSPLGTMIEMTIDRLLIAGVSGAANTLYASKATDFTNFVNSTGVSDAFAEVIVSPGSRLTHIRSACGRILWWKDQSFGYLIGTNQFDLESVIVSNTIGTLDNSSAIDPGGTVWFRAQDGHIYSYDCSSLENRTVDISPVVELAGRRTSNSWRQSTQAELTTGQAVPSGNLSFLIESDSVMVSSFSQTDTLSTDFIGTLSNTQTSGNSVVIATNSTNLNNYSFETGTANTADNWTTAGASWERTTALSLSGGCGNVALNPVDGTYMMRSTTNDSPERVEVQDASTGSTIETISLIFQCSFVQRTFSLSGFTRRMVKLLFVNGSHTITSDPFISNGSISFYYAMDAGNGFLYIDNVTGGRSSISTGTYTSPSFDTGMSYSIARASASWTINEYAPTVTLQTSTAGSSWTELTRSTGADVAGRRYLRYISSFTVSGTNDALSSLDNVLVLARSSGTYYSSIKNAPTLTTWDTFSANKTDNGGSHTFYLRSSTNPFSVLSSTPSWTAQSNGAVVTIATGTYFQFRDDISIDASDDYPALQDFTINWFEGEAADKAYAIFFEDAVWWSVAYGAGQTTNNYILRYDLFLQGWTLYNFGSNGFLIQNNRLYFGSPSAASIFRFGGTTSDNGSAINAYWKSKDFPGRDLWVDNQYNQLDLYAVRNQNEALTVSYAVGTSTMSTSYSVPLSSSTRAIVQSRKNLPTGKVGPTFNVQFGDNTASSAWEVLGFRFNYLPLPYRPTP